MSPKIGDYLVTRDGFVNEKDTLYSWMQSGVTHIEQDFDNMKSMSPKMTVLSLQQIYIASFSFKPFVLLR